MVIRVILYLNTVSPAKRTILDTFYFEKESEMKIIAKPVT